MTRKKLKRIIFLMIAILIIVPLVALGLILFQMDRVVKTGVEYGGKRMLGVNTQLAKADVSVFRGRVQLEGLNVANPPGFTGDTFLKAGLIRIDAAPLSLLRNEVYIQELTLEGPEFTYEIKDGKSNLGVLLDQLEKEPKEPKEKKPKGEKEPVKLKADLIRVKDAKVHVILAGRNIEIDLPELEIRNVADEDGNAVPANELVKVFLRKIMGSIESVSSGFVETGKGLLEEGMKQGRSITDDLLKRSEKTGEELLDSFKK